VEDSGLNGQAFCHAEGQAAGGDPLTVKTLFPYILGINEEWLKQTYEADKLYDVGLGNRPPARHKPIPRMKSLKSDPCLHFPSLRSLSCCHAWCPWEESRSDYSISSALSGKIPKVESSFRLFLTSNESEKLKGTLGTFPVDHAPGNAPEGHVKGGGLGESNKTISTGQRRRSWDQDARPCGFTGFEIAVRLGGVLERVALPDFDFYLAGEHDAEEVLPDFFLSCAFI
jgi:hypothetical protein